jgi:hypothetical protein
MIRLHPIHFQLDRTLAMLALSSGVMLLLYVAPTGVESILILYVSPTLAVGAVGDAAAYLALFFLGFRRTGAAVYLFSKILETLAVKTQMISSSDLLWLSDLFPTIACCILLCWLTFFSAKGPFPDQKV